MKSILFHARSFILPLIIVVTSIGCGSRGQLIIIDDRPKDATGTSPSPVQNPPPQSVVPLTLVVPVSEMQRKADAGDPQAMYLHARALAVKGAEKDKETAREYLQKAMALDCADALLAMANDTRNAKKDALSQQDLLLILDCFVRAERAGAESVFPSDHPRYAEIFRKNSDFRSVHHIRNNIFSIQDKIAGVNGIEAYMAQRNRLRKGADTGDVEAEWRLSLHPDAPEKGSLHARAALELSHPFALVHELWRQQRVSWSGIAGRFDTSLRLDQKLTELYGVKSYTHLRDSFVGGPMAEVCAGLPRAHGIAKFALTKGGKEGRIGRNPTLAVDYLDLAVKAGFRPDDAYLDSLIDPDAPPRTAPDQIFHLVNGMAFKGNAAVALLLYNRFSMLDYSTQSEKQRMLTPTEKDFKGVVKYYLNDLRMGIVHVGSPSEVVKFGDDALAMGDEDQASTLYQSALIDVIKEDLREGYPEMAALVIRIRDGLAAVNPSRLQRIRAEVMAGDRDAIWKLSHIEASGLGAPVNRAAAQAGFLALGEKGNISAALNVHLMALGSFPAVEATTPFPCGFLIYAGDVYAGLGQNDRYKHFAKRLRSATAPAFAALAASNTPASQRDEAMRALALTSTAVDAAVVRLNNVRSEFRAPVPLGNFSATPVNRPLSEGEKTLSQRAKVLIQKINELNASKQAIASATYTKKVTYDYRGIYFNKHSEATYQVSRWTPELEVEYRAQADPLMAELKRIELQITPSQTDIEKAKAEIARSRMAAEETYEFQVRDFERTTKCVDDAIAECRAIRGKIGTILDGKSSP